MVASQEKVSVAAESGGTVGNGAKNGRQQLKQGADSLEPNKPNEVFQRMLINDRKQNKRLSASLTKVNGFSSSASLASLASSSSGGGGGGGGDSNRRTKTRFIVCTLGLFALAVSQMSRMILNQTIKDMVDPAMHQKSATGEMSADGSCPWPLELEQAAASTQAETLESLLLTTTAAAAAAEVYSPTEEPIYEFISGGDDDDNNDAAQTGADDRTVETIHEDRFKWTMKQQSYLLGGFFYGYAFFMIPGGRVAEMYGAKYVVLVSLAGSGLINLATPWMARNSYALLVGSRALMGLLQAGVFPATYALFARWLTATETSLFAPMIKLFLRLGMLFGSVLPGLLSSWPSVYYFTAALSGILSLLWLLVASSSPQGNEWVSRAELEHIMRKKRKLPDDTQQADLETTEQIELTVRTVHDETQSKRVPVKIKTAPKVKQRQQQQQQEKTPWLKILTNPSVIGLIVVKVTFNYAVDFFSILIPSYLSYVHHAPKETVSLITTCMFLLQILLMVFIGWLAKVMIQRRPFDLSKTAIRKIFQGTANGGMALALFLTTFNDCNLLYVAVLLQVMSFLSMFTAGGETMLPYDLSDQYPATIMAIANSVANFSGVTTTFLAGLILGDQSGSYDRWNILINLTAGVNVFGALAFFVLVKAEPIDFTKRSTPAKKTDVDLEQQAAGIESGGGGGGGGSSKGGHLSGSAGEAPSDTKPQRPEGAAENKDNEHEGPADEAEDSKSIAGEAADGAPPGGPSKHSSGEQM